MTNESIFRAAAITNLALCVPVGLYFRIQSQATGERLARREEGPIIMIGLRMCGALAGLSLMAYLINPTWMAWATFPIPDALRWLGAALRGLRGAPALVLDFP